MYQRILLTALTLAAVSAQGETFVADGGFTSTPYKTAPCRSDLGLLNHVTGWQTRWPGQWAQAAELSPADQRAMVETWAGGPAGIDAATSALKRSLAAGTTAPAPVVRRVLQQLDAAYRDLAENNADAARDDEPSPWQTFAAERLLPAVDAYRRFLHDRYLPAAGDRLDLASATGNDACYAHAVAWWTSLHLDAAAVEAIGREQLANARAELAATLEAPETVDDLLAEFRAGRAFANVERADITRVSERAIERAQREAADWFLNGFERPIVVEAIPTHLENSLPAGFYRPGETSAYVVNLSRPASRRAMAEVIAFHEAIPGHHLQASYETAGDGSFTAGFAEGWAIYAEYLADEMGLYSTLVDRQGMMTKHLWSASRLIVEPGLQQHGWTRAEAIAFMEQHTALDRAEIEVEVDRYLAMPGQSLSYTLGYAHLQALRERASAALAARFDIRTFHDVVLGGGMRPLDAVSKDVEAWIARSGPSEKRLSTAGE